MKSNHPINGDATQTWYRCSSAVCAGEVVNWELNRSSHYDLAEAYLRTPHRQLIAASDDEALRNFVKAWGPLRLALGAWSGSDPIEIYRSQRDRLAAIARLLASVDASATQREVLSEWVKLSEHNEFFQMLLASLRTLFSIPGEVPRGFDAQIGLWLETATRKQIEEATLLLVANLPARASSARFTVQRSRSGNAVRASLGLSSLVDALDWMVWQDIFQNHPFRFCAECRKLIPSNSKATKFCSDECAHRQTARLWQQKKRKEKRDSDGTKKTR